MSTCVCVCGREREREREREGERGVRVYERLFFFFFFTLVTGPRRSLSLKLSDTKGVCVCKREGDLNPRINLHPRISTLTPQL